MSFLTNWISSLQSFLLSISSSEFFKQTNPTGSSPRKSSLTETTAAYKHKITFLTVLLH